LKLVEICSQIVSVGTTEPSVCHRNCDSCLGSIRPTQWRLGCGQDACSSHSHERRWQSLLSLQC